MCAGLYIIIVPRFYNESKFSYKGKYCNLISFTFTGESRELELYGAHTPCAASQLHAARQLLIILCFVHEHVRVYSYL